MSVLAVKGDRPKGYGRIVQDENGHLAAIVEEADATEDQKRSTLLIPEFIVSSAVLQALKLIQPDNAQREFLFYGYNLHRTDRLKVCWGFFGR